MDLVEMAYDMARTVRKADPKWLGVHQIEIAELFYELGIRISELKFENARKNENTNNTRRAVAS